MDRNHAPLMVNCRLTNNSRHNNEMNYQIARVSRAGARTGLQLQGHGDMQGFDSSSLAKVERKYSAPQDRAAGTASLSLTPMEVIFLADVCSHSN